MLLGKIFKRRGAYEVSTREYIPYTARRFNDLRRDEFVFLKAVRALVHHYAVTCHCGKIASHRHTASVFPHLTDELVCESHFVAGDTELRQWPHMKMVLAYLKAFGL